MANKTIEELYSEVVKITEKDGEQAAKDFVIANLNEFPEKEKNAIIMAFVEEGLEEQKADSERVLAFQQKGIAKLKELIAEKKELEEKDKLLQIKESI